MTVISMCLAAWTSLLGAMQDPWEPSGACSSRAKDPVQAQKGFRAATGEPTGGDPGPLHESHL